MSDLSLLNTDGTNFKPSDKEVDFIVTNSSINDFLNGGSDSSKAIIAGQKGSGKSIIISYKNYKDRLESTEKNLNIFFIPEEGVEQIKLTTQISSNDISKNVKFTDWQNIFNVAIHYYILAKLRDQLIKFNVLSEDKFDDLPFHDIFNPFKLDYTKVSIGSIVFKCIKNRGRIYKEQGYFLYIAEHLLKSFLTHKEVSVYFDNLDQTLFDSLAIDDSYRLDDSKINKRINLDEFIKNPSFNYVNNITESWFKSHIGYLLAINGINNIHRDLNIYSTFRLEAYEYLAYTNIRNKPNIRGIVCTIEYSDDDFKKVFQKLLEAAKISEEQLKNIKLDNLPHAWVSTYIHNEENLWDFVKRHTLGNPREITFQINALREIVNSYSSKKLSRKDIVLKFKQSISAKALKHIISDFKKETLPFFPHTEFDEFYDRIRKNWIQRDELDDKDISLLVILYRLGLVGVVENKGGDYYQRFQKKNVYFTNETVSLPESKYFLFHPSLDHKLFTKFPDTDFYYPYCILGHDRRFYFLRNKEYYLPKGLKENKEKSDFREFYNTESSFKRYSLIQNKIIEKWSIILWDCIFKISKNKWEDILHKEIFNGEPSHGFRKRSNTENILALQRNYELRIIVSLSSLAGLVNSHLFLKSIFKREGMIREVLYFSNIRGDGNKRDSYLSFLSMFEEDTIKICLDKINCSKKLQTKLNTDNAAKDKMDKLINDMKKNLNVIKH